MTRSHKIGWLVLAVALLFMLWRLPRLHGQGFGSFSHDQPYLAADRASGAILPTIPTGEFLWFRNSTIPNGANGDVIMYWEDSGSNHFYATNLNPELSIVLTNNVTPPGSDRPAVYFSGGSSADLYSPGATNFSKSITGMTAFVVGYWKATADGNAVVQFNNNAGYMRFGAAMWSSSGEDFMTAWGTTTDNSTVDRADGPVVVGSAVDTPWFLCEWEGNYASTSMKFYTNGTLAMTDASWTTGVITPDTPGNDSKSVQLGGAKAVVSEILIYNRILSTDEQNLANYYFSTNFGLFPVESPYTNASVFVEAWANKVKFYGGAAPSAGTRSALTTFYNGLMSSNILSKMIAVNCFVPDNLTAARVPFIRNAGLTAWANNNFVSGDLTTSGLTGNGSTKYLNTGIIPNAISPASSTSAGLSVMIATPASEQAVAIGALNSTGNGGFVLQNWEGSGAFGCWKWTGAADIVSGAISSTYAGFLSGSRTAADAIAIYTENSTNAIAVLGSSSSAQTGAPFATYPIAVFADNAAGTVNAYSSATLSFAAVHAGLTQSETAALYSLVAALRTSLGGGNP